MATGGGSALSFEELVAALREPEAYPEPAPVELRQTHISAVFLVGSQVYKVKKPVKLGFLDFSSREKRLHFCQEEVRLNRRLAPEVYKDVLPIVRSGGRVRVGGTGEAIEHAVWMERLPEEASLKRRLARGAIAPAQLEDLGRRIAAFHARAEAGVAETAASSETVARNALDNFRQTEGQIGVTKSGRVHARLLALSEAELAARRPLIEARRARGVPRDGHGDLHLDHIYLFPERAEPRDLVIVDCIEFNSALRQIDPIADMAFLVMDLEFHERPELAAAFQDAYFAAREDPEGRELLRLYTSYRAAVRAKVRGIQAGEPEVPEAERAEAAASSTAHWLFALGRLEQPGKAPCLMLVGGLPGSGKSTLARALAEREGFAVLSSDVVRKELLPGQPGRGAASGFGQGLYSPAWTERTYSECLARCRERLFQGERVIVDASFRDEAWRQRFLELGRSMGVPSLLVLCEAERGVIRERLARRRGDPSDADWAVYERMAASWMPPGPETAARLLEVDRSGPLEEAVRRVRESLRERGLSGA